MTAIRILHIDDEADLREVIEISLGLDPGFVIRSCESGAEGLAVAAAWDPDIILLDVMMPVMDGPATLLALRENTRTAGIPVIFMTARAQARELDRFHSLGVLGVIGKPFDPMTLAASVRDYLPPAADPLDELRASFLQRVERDVAVLSGDRAALKEGIELPNTLDRIMRTAHGLSGAGGIYGYSEISDAAAALEDAAVAEIAGTGSDKMLSSALDELISKANAGRHRRSEREGATTR
jgi:CheY-like chemotaxis protein